ncbi:MAG: penicillin-binding protein activator [Alphaproteobacteria bacterium]
MRELHIGLRFSSLKFALFTLSALFILSGCVSNGGYSKTPWTPKEHTNVKPAEETPSELSANAVDKFELENAQAMAQGDNIPPVKVAILLPMSGQHIKLGHSMLNAAQLALFDLGFDNFELLPKDTLGTPDGAQKAARAAIRDGAQLVLGPVFSASVKSARPIVQGAGLNMVPFSTDWTLANNKTFMIGFLPFDQIERVTSYASSHGLTRIGVLSPQDNYGDAVVSAYSKIARHTGTQNTHVQRFAPQGNDLSLMVRKFSDYDQRKATGNMNNAPFDAVLLPVGGPLARQVGSFLNHYDMPPSHVRRLGTGLMDDTTLATDKTLDGTWFAAPDPALRRKFETKYKQTYFETPPRIASLAYDATALSIILARMSLQNGGALDYSHRAITNPNGFAGVDGIFRFRPDGISERGLAVLEFNRGRIKVIDKPPRTFQNSAY